MKIIIATNFDNKRLVSKYGQILKQKGHEVYDWTIHKSTRPYEIHKDLSRQYSLEDIDAIRDSDVFILLNNEKCRNSYVELGVAIHSHIIKGKPKIYVLGKKNLIYFFHPSVTSVHNIEQLLLDIN